MSMAWNRGVKLIFTADRISNIIALKGPVNWGTECRVQECGTYRVQCSGVCYVQSAVPGVPYAMSAEFRGELRTECMVQECNMIRVQCSGLCYI